MKSSNNSGILYTSNNSSFFLLHVVICFGGEHSDTFIGTYYSFSGEESDGQICVNVTREEDDVNRFDFESFQYVVSEVATPIFGHATAAGEFASRIIVSQYFPHNEYYLDVRIITVFKGICCNNIRY